MKWAEIPPGLSTNYLFSRLAHLCASHSQSSEEKSEAESLDTTHIFPDSSDADFRDAETLVSRHHPELSDEELSDAESDDAETLNARHGLELVELESNDSRLKEVPKLDGDSRSISDVSEDEEND
ncbi:hypothetical protein OXX59_005854 [Metschnikowia pulcherrima]